MTTLTIPAAELRRGLQTVKPVIVRRSYLPILHNVKFDQGRIVATDLDVTISTPLIGTGPADGLLAPHAALLKSLPTKAAELRGNAILTWADDTLTVQCAGRSVTLHVESVKDFPNLPEVTGSETVLDLVALRSVASAVSTETTRPILCSVYVTDTAMVATDSYRLHLVETSTDLERGVLLSAEMVKAVLKHKGIVKASIRIGQHEAAVTADDGTVFTGRLVEGTFPNYRELIPQSAAHSVTFGRDAMLDVVKDAKAFATEDTTPVRLKVEGETITATLYSRNGDMVRTVPGQSDGELAIAFNPAYFLGILTGAPESVTVGVITALKPAVIRWSDQDGRSYTRLIMPVRVS